MDEVKDHISKLPKPIIHHILSMVDPLDAARTSILSTEWRHIYYSFPVFIFEPNLIREYQESQEEKKHMKMLIHNKLMKLLDDTFQRVRREQQTLARIQKLRLHVNFYDHECASHIDNWIGIASDRNVEVLEVSMDIESPKYYLPNTILKAKSLWLLNISTCSLDHIFSDDTMKFPSLRELNLHYVYVNEQTIHNIISSCPSIETFVLSAPFGLKCFRVSGHHKLKKVEVLMSGGKQRLDKVDIEAPNLQSFVLLRMIPTGSEQLLEINMSACQNLKIIRLRAANITDQTLQDLLSKLPLLEELHLSICNVIQRVKFFSNQLKKLTLVGCRKLVDANIDTPNLVFFAFMCRGMPSLSLKNTIDQLEVVLEFDLYEDFDTLCFLHLREFLAKFRQIKSLALDLSSKKCTFIPEELRGNSVPPLCDVKHLRIKRLSSSLCYVAALLDGLFWSFHPQTVSLKLDSDDKINFTKVLCEKIINRQDLVKEIKIKSFNETEYEMPLRLNTFFDALPIPSGQDICFILTW